MHTTLSPLRPFLQSYIALLPQIASQLVSSVSHLFQPPQLLPSHRHVVDREHRHPWDRSIRAVIPEGVLLVISGRHGLRRLALEPQSRARVTGTRRREDDHTAAAGTLLSGRARARFIEFVNPVGLIEAMPPRHGRFTSVSQLAV